MIKFQSIDTVISDYILHTGEDDLNPALAKQVAEDLVSKVSIPDILDFRIVLLEVVNHKVELPSNVRKIHQVAFKENKVKRCKRVQIVEAMEHRAGCDLKVSLDCPCNTPDCSCDSSQIVFDVDRYWELMHPELHYGHMKHYVRHGGLGNENLPCSPYHSQFSLIRPTSNSFFNADLYVGGCLNLNKQLVGDSVIEYSIDGNYLTVNAPDGQILLSFLGVRQVGGNVGIPDTPDMYELIRYGLDEVVFNRKSRLADKISDRRDYRLQARESLALKQKTLIRVKEQFRIPDFNNWWNWLLNNYNTLEKKKGNDRDFYKTTGDGYRGFLSNLTNR